MVLYRRNPIPGGCTFFTVTLADRTATHLTTHIDALRTAFRTTRAEHPFTIDAIVILPDHLHTILTLPGGDADVAHRWRRIKTHFTKSLTRKGISLPHRDGQGRALWQRRFWDHAIRDDADFENHVNYIHHNPTKHGLVTNPTDWPHSSLHRFIRQGILPSDWGVYEATEGNFGEPTNTQTQMT